MMLQSDDHSYKNVSSFPEVWPNQFGPSMMLFRFKTIGYLSGIETSPGNLGEAGTSIVSLAFFPDQPWKNIISTPFHGLIGMGKLQLWGI